MLELGSTLLELFQVVLSLAAELLLLFSRWILAILWIAWWLFAVDWRKLWPALAAGAWAPFVLLGLLAAIAWTAISPEPLFLGGFTFASFLWKLTAVSLLLAVALFCGWLQLHYRWHPPEMELEPPPAESHGHDEHHGHHH